MSAVDVVLRLVDRINAHDVDGLAALLTTDHRFIDSMGAESSGRATLQAGWKQYFRMVPDYRVDVERTFGEGRDVVLLGVARGTYTADGALRAENRWTTPAAWRARVHDELVAEWQVYADNEPIRRCIARASA
jgi:ketosteroid isomerase-like protein